MWIEIFKSGDHIDSQGRESKWTNEDLNNAVQSYNPFEHEALSL